MLLLKRLFHFATPVAATALLSACGSPSQNVPPGAGGGDKTTQVKADGDGGGSAKDLTGAGSSFVNPAMTKWASLYNQQTGAKVNYQGSGSGAGIQQFTQGVVDFGATDGPMSDQEIQAAQGNVVHIPVVIGSIAVIYNTADLKAPLLLDGKALAAIFMGDIKKWNDPAIAALNKNAQLPDAEIVVCHRAEGSGTTYIFSEYLSKVSPEWKSKIGVGKSLQWPVGDSGKGNEGVAGAVARIPNSIGYVEFQYAVSNKEKLKIALLQNATGNFKMPGSATASAAAADIKDIPEDLRFSITNAPGADAYPISGMTWVLAKSKNDSADKANAVKSFLNFALSDAAQREAVNLNYSKLPPTLLEKAKAKVAAIQ